MAPGVEDGLATAAESSPVGPSPELVRLVGHLRSSLARHVARRREAGASLDRVLVEVRRLAHQAVALEGWRDASDPLVRQVVRWSIAAYYNEPAPNDGPCCY